MLIAILVDGLLYLTITICAITDISSSRIPNKVTYPAVVAGLVLALIAGGWHGLLNSMLGFGLGFGMTFLIFLWGGFGGGDVKLMAAIGALKGYPFIIYAAFYAAIVGGIYSLVVVIWRGQLWRTMVNIGKQLVALVVPFSAKAESWKLERKDSVAIPFGFCISLGTLWAMLESMLHQSLWQWFLQWV